MENKEKLQDDAKIKNLVSELLDKKITSIFEEFPFDTLGLANIDLLEITVNIKDTCDKDIFALVNGDPAADRGNLVSSYEYVLTAYPVYKQ